MGHRGIQIALVCGALLLVIGMIFAPRLPREKRVVEANPLTLQINEAVELVQNGENPMQGIMMKREILA